MAQICRTGEGKLPCLTCLSCLTWTRPENKPRSEKKMGFEQVSQVGRQFFQTSVFHSNSSIPISSIFVMAVASPGRLAMPFASHPFRLQRYASRLYSTRRTLDGNG